MCVPAATAGIVLACYSHQKILMGMYPGSDAGQKKEVRKKSSQDNVLQSRNSTEVFVCLLLHCAIAHFFSHWCGMTYETLCWKTNFTNSIRKYKQITKTYSYQ